MSGRSNEMTSERRNELFNVFRMVVENDDDAEFLAYQDNLTLITISVDLLSALLSGNSEIAKLNRQLCRSHLESLLPKASSATPSDSSDIVETDHDEDLYMPGPSKRHHTSEDTNSSLVSPVAKKALKALTSESASHKSIQFPILEMQSLSINKTVQDLPLKNNSEAKTADPKIVIPVTTWLTFEEEIGSCR